MAKETAQQAGSSFFEDLQDGLLEATAHFHGEIELKTTTITILDPPPAYDAERIRTLRTGLGFSQPYFSHVLSVSPKTVQSWEQGTRVPSRSSARLLQLIENPHLLDSLRRYRQAAQETVG